MYVKHMVAKGQEAAVACDRMLDVPGEIITQLKAA